MLDSDSKDFLEKAKILTRSTETVNFLAKEGIQSKALVCPALFSSMFRSEPTRDRTLYIVQKPGRDWHEIQEPLLSGLVSTADILCLHVKEYLYYKEQGFEYVHYAASGTSAIEIIRKYESVISTRLHGAIAALSLGIPAVVVGSSDFRIRTCASMFGGYLPCVGSITEAEETLLRSGDEINDFKWEKWNEYITTLKEIW